MKLIDCNPSWIGLAGGVPFYFGVSFDCPHCLGIRTTSIKRLAVHFWPPIDPENWNGRITPIPHEGFHNRISGEDFRTLNLSPSVGFESINHWHGYITNGEMI